MVIIVAEKENSDELSPPPAYTATSDLVATSSAHSTSRSQKLKLTTLPSYILLHIIYQTLPQIDGKYYGESRSELQRKVLYWMTVSLRLVNRALYISAFS